MANGAFPEFTTERLRFRQLKKDDVYDVFKLFSDSETMMFDGGMTMGNIEEAMAFIQTFSSIDQPAIRWAITSKDTNEFFGTAGFHHIDYFSRKAEIGGEVLKSYWGKGIGKEGIQALLTVGFYPLGLNRIEALISPDNKKAQRLVKVVPFKKEGYLRQYQRWGDKYVDLEIYSLLKSEWIEYKKHNR
ncbi:ribosomal-protein-alanine N-acetyltransferase [Scopulibacillus daqui]|uniref:Ribosomal-protein-alanine N-acetyltransferase n=1 Tax=Scopulibacillus daqui TaxID=1469162 RepID=A0ABS2PZB7_9BACL|nr:GNAT family protein [Scopulibacillus daqui]MBM7645216.1 ribosomal-protein-alanine N-acetyltransferase [Scopulibacillus daqui]